MQFALDDNGRTAPLRLPGTFLVFFALCAAAACHRKVAGTPKTESTEGTPPAVARAGNLPPRSFGSASLPSAVSAVPQPSVERLDRSTIKERLRRAHFSISSATETTSGEFHSVRVTARCGNQTVTVELYQPGDAYWSSRLKTEHAAIRKRGSALLGVVVRGDRRLAKRLAASLAR